MSIESIVVFLDSVVALSTPILLAALGEMILQRTGVLNIGLEGVMLMGAFIGYIFSLYTGNVYLGILGAILGGIVVALIHGVISITLTGDQVVSGISLNILSYGLTTFGLKSLFGLREVPIKVPALQEVPIPILSDIPVVGEVLFKQTFLVYLIYILIPLIWFIMNKTTWGLKLKAVGEDPRVADAVGINVILIKYMAIILNGILGGLAGAILSIALLDYFTAGMTAGKGFLALAAVIFGRWTTQGVVIASLIFGGVDALQIRLQLLYPEIPYPFMLMLPYLVTIIALVSLKSIRPPRSLAIPYKRE